jgi:hypothetical protein
VSTTTSIEAIAVAPGFSCKTEAYSHRTGFLCYSDWSPDGQQLTFARCDDSGGGVFGVSALCGSECNFSDVACLNLAVMLVWTSDGPQTESRPLLTYRCTPDAPRDIVIFSLQTGEKRCLHSPPVGDSGDTDVALPPDESDL